MTEDEWREISIRMHYSKRITVAMELYDAPGAREKLEKPDPDLFFALLARVVPDTGFTARVEQALASGDFGLFDSISEAIRLRHAVAKRRRSGIANDGSRPSFPLHAAVGFSVLEELVVAGEPIPRKGDLSELIQQKLIELGAAPYEDASDWRKLWKVLEVEKAPQKHVGRTPKPRKR